MAGKRSSNQIANLRRVFAGMYGPLMLFLNDEEIDAMGDDLQRAIDRLGDEEKKTHWYLKIRVSGDKTDWALISAEPKFPWGTEEQIINSVARLLNTYPFDAILLLKKDDPDYQLELTLENIYNILGG